MSWFGKCAVRIVCELKYVSSLTADDEKHPSLATINAIISFEGVLSSFGSLSGPTKHIIEKSCPDLPDRLLVLILDHVHKLFCTVAHGLGKLGKHFHCHFGSMMPIMHIAECTGGTIMITVDRGDLRFQNSVMSRCVLITTRGRVQLGIFLQYGFCRIRIDVWEDGNTNSRRLWSIGLI